MTADVTPRFAPKTQTRSVGPARFRGGLRTSGLYLLVLLCGVGFLFPLFWTISTSLKTRIDCFLFPPVWWPSSPQWVNYPTVLQDVPFLRWTYNTALVTGLSLIGAVASSCIVAYSFARFEYPGRDLLFIITLGTMMFPGQITLIPTFVLFHKLQWLNTFKPLIVPAYFGGGAFNIFLLRQFIMTLPRELDEAAVLDGAGYIRIFISVVLPLMKPAIATVAVIHFIGEWNEFMGPFIYLNSPEKFTLAVGLRYYQFVPHTASLPQDNLMMAMVVMSSVPCFVLFFLAQRVFVQGIALTGIKG